MSPMLHESARYIVIVCDGRFVSASWCVVYSGRNPKRVQ